MLSFSPISFVASQPPYPIQDASVDISDVTPDGFADTDSSGNFMITGLGTGHFTGTIRAEGYMDQSINGTITQGITTNIGDIYLQPSAVIKGTVNSHTGSPVASTTVYLLNQNNNTVGHASTESDGSFTIDMDIETGIYSIYASAPGFFWFSTGTDATSAIMTGISATEGQTTSGITLTLLQSGTISGQVTDSLNNGIANITVLAEPNNGDDRYGNLAMTDATGHYSMTANLAAGSYNVSVWQASAITGYVFNTTDVKTVSVTAGGTVTANFKLQRSGSISGTVTQYDGSPAANETVFASGSGGIGFAKTKADGTYLIDTGLGTGQYTVFAGDYFNSKTVNVVAGSLTPSINFRLGYNLAWIAGKVSNSTGPLIYADVDGKYNVPNPINPSINSTDSSSASPDKVGYYLMEIQVPGNWTSVQVNLTASDSGYLESSQTAIAYKGMITSNVNFILQQAPAGALKGRVVSNTAPPKLSAALSISTSATTISTGTQLTLSGALMPSQSGAVTIYESVNSGAWSVLTTRTLSSGGIYSYSFLPSTVGIHQYYAWWPGNSLYNIAQSSTIQVNLTSQPLQTASLSISGSTTITVNTTYIVQGTLSPIRTGNVTVYRSYNSSAFTVVATPTLSAGSYTYTFTPSATGTYQFYAVWAGDSITTPANSTTTSISVTPVQPTTPTLTLQSSSANVNPGQAVTLSGTINPSASGTVTIWQSVNSSAYQQIANATLTNGAYSYQHTIPGAGTYQFKASFAGNSQLNAVQSAVATVGSGQAVAPDYTMYIVGGVVAVAIIIVAYYFMAMRPKNKPAK